MGTRILFISRHLLRRIIEHCMEEKPLEACGLLLGRSGKVLHAYATDNSVHSPFFYEVDAAQQRWVLQEMQRRGESLLGIYHSHPNSDARPSTNDVRLAAYWPEAIRLIVSLQGPAEVRAFLIVQGDICDVEVRSSADEVGEWHDLRRGSAW